MPACCCHSCVPVSNILANAVLQGGSCGFGMRGQKSRSGRGMRPGFQGGQTPLYRQMPKLRGIAGGRATGISAIHQLFVPMRLQIPLTQDSKQSHPLASACPT